jgi:hypothetical protein
MSVFVVSTCAIGQTVAQNTQTEVIDIARINNTDTLLVSEPKALVVKPEPAWQPSTVAKPDTTTGSDGWHLEVRPYLWLAGIDGTLRVNNTIADVGQGSSDILGMLDFAAAVQLEAIKGNWRLMFDENYVNLGTSGTGPFGLVTVDVQPTMNIFEFGGSYTAAAIPNKKATADDPYPPVFSAEVLGGVRWFHLGLGLQANNNPGVEGSRNLFGPFIGNRFKASPHKAVTFVGKYTIGGSGAGTGFAWSAEGLVDLRFKKSFSLAGGYRVLDLKANQSENVVGFDGQLRGLVLYMTFYR